MDQTTRFRPWMALAAIVLLAGLAALVYQSGISQGMAQGMFYGAQMTSASKGSPAAPGMTPWGGYYPMPGWHSGPFGGFSCFSVLIPIFLLFLFFGVMRGMFGHGRHNCGPWGQHWEHHWAGHHGWGSQPGQAGQPGEPTPPHHAPPFFEEWHRRAHAASSTPETPAGYEEQPPQE